MALAANNPYIEEEKIVRTVRVTPQDTCVAACSSITWKVQLPQEEDAMAPSFFDFLRSQVGDLQNCDESEVLNILNQLHRYPLLPAQ